MNGKYTFSIHTLGCKVNSYESDIMIQKCLDAGFVHLPFGEKSDIVIINTCAVTEESARKSKQYARRAKRENPDCILVVSGCYSQICDDDSLDFADVVLGTKNKSEIVRYIDEFIEKKNVIVDIPDISSEKYFEPMLSDSREHVRATVKIQDGCNNFCSYCIIPYARGRIRSKDFDDAINEVSMLAKAGYREIVLTGIHLTSYGLETGKYDLTDFLEKADEIPGIKRIRLGSLEPKYITEKTVERLKNLKNLCHHFHLSLQSGCDTVLKRMNRKYTSEEFKNAAKLLKSSFDDASLTADVIVGFCGETDEEFRTTCDFVREIGFSKIHLFPFSKRKGTAAYKMEDVSDEIKKERMKVLGKIEKQLESDFRTKMIGNVCEILTERSANGFTEGYTSNYTRIKARGNLPLNEFVKVLITEANGEFCVGDVVR